jgi:hypothetical protein
MMDEFSVTLMRTKVTPGTVRYDAVGDADAFLRNVYVNKRAFKGGRFPELLLVTCGRRRASRPSDRARGPSARPTTPYAEVPSVDRRWIL